MTADLDRRGTLALVGSMTLVGSFLAFAFGGTVAGEIVPGLEAVGGLSSAGAVLALARGYWASSTRTARERLGGIMDSLNRFLTQSGNATLADAVERRAETAGTEGEPAGDAS